MTMLPSSRTTLPLCVAAALTLTACGGGSDANNDAPTNVTTQSVNPSSSATTVVVALPNAQKLETSTFGSDSGTGLYSVSAGGMSYTLDAWGDVVEPSGATSYADVLVMICASSSTLVLSQPGADDPVVPAAASDIVGKTFAFVDNCTIDTDDTLTFRPDGSAQSPEGVSSKSEVDAYFSTGGQKDGNDIYRAHIYGVQTGSVTRHIIVETYRENGVDHVAMLVELP